MNTRFPPPPAPPTSTPFPRTASTLSLLRISPPSSSSISTKSTTLIRAEPTSSTISTAPTHHSPPPINHHHNSQDNTLLSLLRQRKTDEAWLLYSQSPHLPNPTCLSRLVSQLSYQNTPQSFSRAQSIISRLRHERQLHRLDSNSLGLLAVSAVKSGHTLYAISIIKSMLRSNYLPHVKAWSAVVSRLSGSPDSGPADAVRLFYSVIKRIRRVEDRTLVAHSCPDTAAFNAVLNAFANLGDVKKFCQVFDEMSEWDVVPDALTYNVVIKLCARVDRKDLLVCVLELMLSRGIEPCVTTLHSLVAAYVGFGDLGTAEKLVQALREGRRDLCRILRDENIADADASEDDRICNKHEIDSIEKLIPRTIIDNSEPPLLPKLYSPDSRIYTTLMKGYMKAGRVSDTVRMLEAMRRQEDSGSHPDHVSYTTVISAQVKAGSMERARQVLDEMRRVGVPANLVTYNILLKGYCQKLQVEKAKEVMREMSEVGGITPDVVSYNTMIDGCILVDDSAGAVAYFNEMRARGIGPTKISYTTLMKAFALTGQPKLAGKVFEEMERDPRVKVDKVGWNMLVEGYCKMGMIEEAKKVVERMREKGSEPDVATYGSLANGIALARKPGEALILWNEVKERSGGIKPDEGLLDTLADICVRAGFFRKALEIVACMEEYGISPNKTKFTRIYVEMHSKMFTSKHASKARQDRRRERKRAAEAFKFWLGLPNEYYATEWSLNPPGHPNAYDSDSI